MKTIVAAMAVFLGVSGGVCAESVKTQLSVLTGGEVMLVPAVSQGKKVTLAFPFKPGPVELRPGYRKYTRLCDSNTTIQVAEVILAELVERLKSAGIEVISKSVVPSAGSLNISIEYISYLPPREAKSCGSLGYCEMIAREWLTQKDVLVNFISSPSESGGDFGEGPLYCIRAAYQPLAAGAILKE